MASCIDNEDDFAFEAITVDQTPTFRVTEDGYLHFDSQQTFDEFYTEARNAITTSAKSRAVTNSSLSIPGFSSIKDISAQCNARNKSRAISESIEEDDYDCEEGNEDECRFAIANELIPDEALQCLLDTTLRIEIGNTYYRITGSGTLYADITYKGRVDSLAVSDIVANTPVGSNLYEVDSDIYILDTYGRLLGNDDTTTQDNSGVYNAYNPGGYPYHPPTTISPNAPTREDSYFWGTEEENSSYYSLIDRKWDAKTFVGDLLETLTGCKYIKEENNFDKNHRVQCSLYNLDFAFVNAAGYKIELQKRKKFLFITYWTACSGAQDLVVGFENFQGSITIPTPISLTNPVAIYESQLNGTVYNTVYAGLSKPTFIEDWAKDFFPCIFQGALHNKLEEWKLNPGRYTDHLTKDMITLGTKTLFGKTLDGMRNALKKGDPILNINPYSENKHDYYIYGINGWTGKNHMSIKFGLSFGLNFSNGSLSSWTPEKYEITHPQMFGAIKYNNQWRGVRFTEP